MHIPNGLIWVHHTGIQAPIHDTAFTFPTANDLNSTDEIQWQEYNTRDSDEQHYYYGYSILRQLIYPTPLIFIPRLSGFFYRPGYGSASSHGNG